MATEIELTQDQFNEICKNLQAAHQAIAMEADRGELENTIVKTEWEPGEVKITITLD